MTLAELKNILTAIQGYTSKVTYYAWPTGEAPDLPFICFLEKKSNNFVADGKVYTSVKSVDVELYTDEKEPDEEAKVETALTGAGIVWVKECEYIETEKCWMITYTIEV